MKASTQTFTIVGQQPDQSPRGYRNRYAGVNTKGTACVLTMGEYRTYRQRVYFETLDDAQAFFDKFTEKFADRGIRWAIKFVSPNNMIIGSELKEIDSDCGKALQRYNPNFIK